MNEHKDIEVEETICSRCEGNGLIYADYKAHCYSEHYPTIPCPDCEGEGYINSNQ